MVDIRIAKCIEWWTFIIAENVDYEATEEGRTRDDVTGRGEWAKRGENNDHIKLNTLLLCTI